MDELIPFSLILLEASMPSILGKPISIKITSGFNSYAIVTAWRPSSACPTSSNPSVFWMNIAVPILAIMWSSTRRTFMFLAAFDIYETTFAFLTALFIVNVKVAPLFISPSALISPLWASIICLER